MEKTINVGGKEVKFKATASTTRKYRERFNRDLLVDFQALTPSLEKGELSASSLAVFENIAYIMARQADDTIPNEPDEWLDEFDMFSIYEILPQLIALWGDNMLTLENPKKKVEEQKGN